MTDAKTEKPAIPEGVEFVRARIAYPEFEDTPAAYATNFVIQRTGHEYLVSFYAVFPPALVGLDDELAKARIEAIGAIPARCVGRIVLTNERMVEFVELMNQHMDRPAAKERAGAKNGD